MSGISTGVGLFSGINFVDLVDQLTALGRQKIVLLEQRAQAFTSENTALKTLEATLLTLTSSGQTLGSDENFGSYKVDNSGTDSLSVTSNDNVTAANYQFQGIRKAATHVSRSQGFGDPAVETLGTGSISIINGGLLHNSTELDSLGGGNGVQRGSIKISDRSGNSVEIDLTDAFSVDDVLEKINSASGISVEASTLGGRLVLTDTSGSTAFDLTVSEVDGGQTAADLGIAGSTAGNVHAGSDVYFLTGDFLLSRINDGNGPKVFADAADIRITLSDDTQLDVDLDDASTLGQLIDAINDHEDNNGKVAASLVDSHLQLDDQSGGGGAGLFTIEDINGASVVEQIGLGAAAVGTQITGRGLLAGINSSLLTNLRGGQGIDEVGQLSLTDRAGLSATVDLSGAESLDEVIAAINAAEDSGTALELTAAIDELGTGIVITDTSGATAGNLVVADVGTSTLAAQLGIAIDDAVNSVSSGSLALRYANESTSVSDYLPQGSQLSTGSIRITDSAGNQASVAITESVETIGDLLVRINAATGIDVRAELNETGDGFVVIDEAGGAGELTIEEVDGTTAEELRLLGESVVGGDGKQRISSRLTTVIDVAADDTINDVVERINESGGRVTATLIDDGSAFNSHRLVLTANDAGAAGRFVVDDGGLGLNLTDIAEGRDALLRVGADARTGFLIRSESNVFEDAALGVDVEILTPSSQAATVTVSRDHSGIKEALQGFVSGFNTYIGVVNEATAFDVETNVRGILQGSGVVLRSTSGLQGLVNRQFLGSSAAIRSLGDLGIRFGDDGKLLFDTSKFDAAIENDQQAVADFFVTETTGFAATLESTLESFTDPFTGSFALAQDALQASVDSLEDRAALLDELLLSKRDRLLQQFIQMERALGELSSQQQALSGIAPISVPSVGMGIL